jgi:hypothetical protein
MPRRGNARAWTFRITVLVAFGLTVWFHGPRATEVLAARLRGASRASPVVALDAVGLRERPEWLTGDLLVAVLADLQPWLDGGLPILDDDGARRLRAGLSDVAWVAGVHFERVFPDRLRASLTLRRPVLRVRSGDGAPICLVDRTGVVLPWLDLPELPETTLRAEGGRTSMVARPGAVAPDDRVVAAAAVAVEWRDELRALMPEAPLLLEVDATNLGERWLPAHARYPEIRVALRRDDGAAVVFAYDHPPGSAAPRIATADKAAVLRKILARYPGLHGLVAGDLRFTQRWQDWLQPRDGPDPAAPWADAAPADVRAPR